MEKNNVPNHQPELIYLWGDTRPCDPHARDCYEQREQMDMQPAGLAYSLVRLVRMFKWGGIFRMIISM